MTEAPLEHRRSTRPPIREVTPTGILRWLRLGFRDLFKAGWPSLAHGLIVTAISLVIIGITFLFWPLLPGAVSGFLVVGPVLAAVMIAGRVGGAVSAELGTMRVTEQIDALYAMATEPIHYLVVPRVNASILMLPVLTLIGDAIGLADALVTGDVSHHRASAAADAGLTIVDAGHADEQGGHVVADPGGPGLVAVAGPAVFEDAEQHKE